MPTGSCAACTKIFVKQEQASRRATSLFPYYAIKLLRGVLSHTAKNTPQILYQL
jgi:hypothetical protein